MTKIATLKPNDPDVIYYSSGVKKYGGVIYAVDYNGLFVKDFYHDYDDFTKNKPITEKEALEKYSKFYDKNNFYDLYA